MKRKGKESKMNVVLTVLLVTFVWLLSFSIGVISGKGWSDRDYKVRSIEADNHLKQAQNDEQAVGEEITDKEVELLTQKALEEARATDVKAPPSQFTESAPNPEEDKNNMMAKSDLDKMAEDADKSERELASSDKGESGTAPGKKPKKERVVSSLPPKPTTPKPTSIEYTVQVASYKTMQEAESHSQKLIDKGFPAFPVKAKVKKQTWYRVSVGSFKSRKQALKYQRDLKKQAVVKNSIVQKVSRK